MALRNLIFYELNEVPWRVIDWYVKKRPNSTLADILPQAKKYTTLTKDEGGLHPWSTWPTVHRGVCNTLHAINFLNQDKTCAQTWPPLWETLADAHISVGVFGSLQSYPIPNKNFSFYIPDTFSPGSETVPKKYSYFQELNLKQTKADGALASKIKWDLRTLVALFKIKLLGLRWRTIFQLMSHLVKEKINPLHKSRRPQLQAPVSFDLFLPLLKKYTPQFSTYFTNHVAGTMHRYWKYSFPQDFNYTLNGKKDIFFSQSLIQAMDITDNQLKRLKKYADNHNSDILVVSSMGQEARDCGQYLGELRIVDPEQFAKAISYTGPFKNHLAMQPDFNFEFETFEQRDDFYNKALNIVDTFGNSIYYYLCKSGKTISLNIGRPLDLLEKEHLVLKTPTGVMNIRFSDAGMEKIVRDKGTGHHQPEGIFIWYSPLIDETSEIHRMESTDIHAMILSHFGLSSKIEAPSNLIPTVSLPTEVI